MRLNRLPKLNNISLFKISLLPIFIFLLIILSSTVFALGIAPAQTQIALEEGSYQFNGIIINNEQLDIIAQLSYKSNVDEISITFSQDQITLTKEKSEFPFTYEINVSENISSELSGQRIGQITLSGMQDIGQIAAQLTLTSPLYLGEAPSQRQINSEEIQTDQNEDQEIHSQEEKNKNTAIEQSEKQNQESFVISAKNKLVSQKTNNSPKALIITLAAVFFIGLFAFVIGFGRSKEL